MTDGNLHVSFKKTFPQGVTIDISFQTKLGFTVLFGRSAAGKSVTLAAVAGLLRPESGHISLGSRTFFDAPGRIDLRPQDRNIGYVFQSYALFPHMTVGQNIELALQARPSRGGFAEKAEIVHELGITDILERFPSQLSGGQQQRAALARALVSGPDLLLLDEPFSALDAPVRDRLRSLIKNVQRRYQVPIMMITHQPFEAFYLAEDLVVIENGMVSQQGTPDEVFYHPRTVSVARLVGMKNIYQGKVLDSGQGSVKISSFGRTIEADRGIAVRAGDISPGSAIDWSIRPEDVMILRKDQPMKSAVKENQFDAVIQEIERYGPTWELLLAVDSSFIIKAALPAHSGKMLELEQGELATVSLKRHSIHLMRGSGNTG